MAAAVINKWKNIKIPGSFSSAGYFYRGLKSSNKTGKKTFDQVQGILKKNINFQTSRLLRKNFPRRRDLAFYFSERMEADLGDIGPNRFVDIKTKEEKGRYFIITIDLFSRKIWARGLRNKTAEEVYSAIKDIFEGFKAPYTFPQVLETDQGLEFANKKLRGYLDKKKVTLKLAVGANKARSVERAIRSFKKVLIPYLETRPDLSWAAAVNDVSTNLGQRFQRSIGMPPDEVPRHWEELQARNLKLRPTRAFMPYLREQIEIGQGKAVKEGHRSFAVGDKVVVPFKKKVLDKESDRQFTYQVMTIVAIMTEERPYLYQLEDGKGDKLKRFYYAQELRKVEEPEYYPVSGILDTKTEGRRKFVLVSWLDHGSKFNEWIPASYLKTK